jgi:hypothetical protein
MVIPFHSAIISDLGIVSAARKRLLALSGECF